jgi:hypothetical protein
LAQQGGKVLLRDDVTLHLILKLRLPVEGDRAGNVPAFVLRGVHIDFNQVYLIEVVCHPLC